MFRTTCWLFQLVWNIYDFHVLDQFSYQPKIAPLPDLTSYIVAAPQPIGALEMCGVFAAGVVIGFIFCKVLTPSNDSCDWGSSSDC